MNTHGAQQTSCGVCYYDNRHDPRKIAFMMSDTHFPSRTILCGCVYVYTTVDDADAEKAYAKWKYIIFVNFAARLLGKFIYYIQSYVRTNSCNLSFYLFGLFNKKKMYVNIWPHIIELDTFFFWKMLCYVYV